MDDLSRITLILDRLERIERKVDQLTYRFDQRASVNICSSCATGSMGTIVTDTVAPTAKVETDVEESEPLIANGPSYNLKETIDELQFDRRTSETFNNDEEFNNFGKCETDVLKVLTSVVTPNVLNNSAETNGELKCNGKCESVQIGEEAIIFSDNSKTAEELKALTSKEAPNLVPNSKEINGALKCDEKNVTEQNSEEGNIFSGNSETAKDLTVLTSVETPTVLPNTKETNSELKYDGKNETDQTGEDAIIFSNNSKTAEELTVLTSKQGPNVVPNSKETNSELKCDRKNETLQNGEEEIISGFARNSIEFGVAASEKLIQAMKEKEAKLKKGDYASYLDALFDGAPIFDKYNESDEEGYEADSLSKKKQKREVCPRPYSPVVTYIGATNITYLREYPRQIKPMRGLINVEIVNVISAIEIYLCTVKQKECLEKHISPLLNVLSESADCEPLWNDLFLEYVACAFKDSVTNQWCRARLGPVAVDIEKAKIPVFLIDYGRQVWVDYEKRQDLKSLRAKGDVQNEAQLYKCRLRELCRRSPAEVESTLLKELLPVGSEFSCCFDLDRREPYKVELSNNADGKSIVEIFESEMKNAI